MPKKVGLGPKVMAGQTARIPLTLLSVCPATEGKGPFGSLLGRTSALARSQVFPPPPFYSTHICCAPPRYQSQFLVNLKSLPSSNTQVSWRTPSSFRGGITHFLSLRTAAGHDQQLQVHFLRLQLLAHLSLPLHRRGLLRRGEEEEEAEAKWASQGGRRHLGVCPNAGSYLRRQGRCREASGP